MSWPNPMTAELIARVESARGDVADDEARLAAERALAAEMFPIEWSWALNLTGKRGTNQRAKLRKAAVYAQRLRPLRDAGARCATCKHWKPVLMERGKRHCENDSDFHGYAITAPDHLCPDWALKAGALPEPQDPPQ